MIKSNCILYAFMVIWVCLYPSWVQANAALSVTPEKPVANVRLPANPSTGYQWTVVQYDATLMLPPEQTYAPAQTGIPGAPGWTTWQFKFKKNAFISSRKTAVILEYKRPWENTAVKQQLIEINILGKSHEMSK